MIYLFISTFIAGLLLGVRLMFFGAERMRVAPGDLPLRRSEPAIVAFLAMFGLAGYLLMRHSTLGVSVGTASAAVIGALFAAAATRLAIAAARMKPEHDPEDPRYVLQGRVAMVTADIPAGGEGAIRYEDGGAFHTIPARDIAGAAIAAGQEACIERVDDGVAYVELWALVEQRL